MPEPPIQNRSAPREIFRALLLSLYFFITISGYYLLKPLSRSLYITYLGSDRLPFVWMTSVLMLAVIVPIFHKYTRSISASVVVHATTLACVGTLLGFLVILEKPSAVSSFLFYVAVDVFSVVLVEVFWSLANTSYKPETGRGWYGVLASGGLLGGIAGGLGSSWFIDSYHFAPVELILPAVMFFLLALLLARSLFRAHYLTSEMPKSILDQETFRDFFARLRESREARAIVFILCFAQLIEPLVEFQFMSSVEHSISSLSERTTYVSNVFALVSAFGLGISIIGVPLIHKFFGAMGGLVLQPLLIGIFSCLVMLKGSLTLSSLLKITDRGLAYSTGRASRELLYTKLDGDTNFRLKAWVDVLGYRLFRIVGSMVVLAATYLVGASEAGYPLIMLVNFVLALIWLIVLVRVRPEA